MQQLLRRWSAKDLEGSTRTYIEAIVEMILDVQGEKNKNLQLGLPVSRQRPNESLPE
jgi:hypothetical protein